MYKRAGEIKNRLNREASSAMTPSARGGGLPGGLADAEALFAGARDLIEQREALNQERDELGARLKKIASLMPGAQAAKHLHRVIDPAIHRLAKERADIGLKMQEVQQKLKLLNLRLRSSRFDAMESVFVEVCRDALSPELFRELMERTERIQQDLCEEKKARPWNHGRDYVEISYRRVRQAECSSKTFCIEIDGMAVTLPRSQIRNNNLARGTLEIPRWLAENRSLA